MPKLCYCHNGSVNKTSKKTKKKNPIKKTNQKNLIKMVRSKTTCPKWHFGQIGQRAKNTIWGVFIPKIHGKKKSLFLVVLAKWVVVVRGLTLTF